MNTRPYATASLADVKQLTYFRIYKTNPNEEHGTIKLFSNGNQQCPITVGLIAADADANPITLTQAEIKQAVTLIFYDDAAELGDGYAASFTANDFEWTESAIPAESQRPGDATRGSNAAPNQDSAHGSPQAIQTTTLYVSAIPGSSVRSLAARFEVNPDLYFTTSPVASGTARQARDGDFDSSVEVLLAEPPFLSATDFGAASSGVVTGKKVGDTTTYFYWATEYYLNPKLNGRALPLRSVGASKGKTDAFGFYVYGDFFASVQWGISYFSQPGKTVASGLPMAPLSWIDVGSQRSNAGHRAGAATVTTSVRADGDVDSITTTVRMGGRDAARGRHGSPQTKYLPKDMFDECVGSIQGANANRVVIGILKGNIEAAFKNTSGGTTPEVSSTTMHIMDAYGNDHVLSLSYDAYADEFMIS
jgi:hypothetical protein